MPDFLWRQGVSIKLARGWPLILFFVYWHPGRKVKSNCFALPPSMSGLARGRARCPAGGAQDLPLLGGSCRTAPPLLFAAPPLVGCSAGWQALQQTVHRIGRVLPPRAKEAERPKLRRSAGLHRHRFDDVCMEYLSWPALGWTACGAFASMTARVRLTLKTQSGAAPAATPEAHMIGGLKLNIKLYLNLTIFPSCWQPVKMIWGGDVNPTMAPQRRKDCFALAEPSWGHRGGCGWPRREGPGGALETDLSPKSPPWMYE